MSGQPKALLVNPVVQDFAAYDFWARPLGLLWLGGMLRQGGALVELLDCMDPLGPWTPPRLRVRRSQGRGRFVRTPIDRPAVLPPVGRRYCQYGLPPELLEQALAGTRRPDVVLVGSGMSYWYPGVTATIQVVKQQWPQLPVLLGGVYASLCADHARKHSGADRVLPGPAGRSLPLLWELLELRGVRPEPGEVLPAHELAPHADAGALMTSSGCPKRCGYCGVATLQPRFEPLAPQRVEQEVRSLVRLGVRDIAIYDDAFLADPRRAVDILKRVATLRPRLRLHAASGLSCKGLTPRVARAMRGAGFATVRLGLETSDPVAQADLGGKLTTSDFLEALEHLEAAGYRRDEVGVYVMAGMPGQSRHQVQQTVDLVLRTGAVPHLAEYSPVPGSPLFPEAQAASRWDLQEPLFHNPTLMPCAAADLDAAALANIKQDLRLELEGRQTP